MIGISDWCRTTCDRATVFRRVARTTSAATCLSLIEGIRFPGQRAAATSCERLRTHDATIRLSWARNRSRSIAIYTAIRDNFRFSHRGKHHPSMDGTNFARLE